MLPYYGKTVEPDKVIVECKMLTVDLKLNYDRTRCTGCGTCILVCPKSAIERGPVGAAIKHSGGIYCPPAIMIDESKCVFCGTCSYLCPFFALKLEINGEQKLIIVENQAVPKLPAEFVDCERKGIKARRQFKGKIRLHPENCPGGCSTCVNICPTGALYIPSPKEGWEKVPRIALDEEKCIYCGACVNACPAKRTILQDKDKHIYETECPIELEREVLYEGEHTEYWDEIMVKLRTPLK